jgi:hypothetical protein
MLQAAAWTLTLPALFLPAASDTPEAVLFGVLAAVVVAGGAWLVAGLDTTAVGLCTGWTVVEAGASGLDAAGVFEGVAFEGAAEEAGEEAELAGGFDAGDSLPPSQLLERPWMAELDVMVWTLVPQLAYWARWMLLPVRSKTAAQGISIDFQYQRHVREKRVSKDLP